MGCHGPDHEACEAERRESRQPAQQQADRAGDLNDTGEDHEGRRVAPAGKRLDFEGKCSELRATGREEDCGKGESGGAGSHDHPCRPGRGTALSRGARPFDG